MLFRSSFLIEFVRAEFKNSYMRYFSVILSFAVAISLLISLSSFGKSLSRSMYEDSKSLLGADIAISRNANFDEAVFKEIGGIEHSKETVFTSMVQNKKNNKSRLVQVRAQNGGFPYYGETIIEPPHAIKSTLSNISSCLIDESISSQLGLGLGDQIKLGSSEYIVSGIIKKYPGDTYGKTLIAPKIIIPIDSLDQTNLLKKGSRVSNKIYIKATNSSVIASRLSQLKEQYGFEIETTEDSQKKLGKVFEQIAKYILLLSILLVALSAIGLYTSLRSFIKDKIPSILTLFCLGATRKKIIIHYLFVCMVMSSISFLIALGISVGLVYLLPSVFSDFLTLSVKPSIDPREVGKCFILILMITVVSVYFALAPILNLHPNQVLRDHVEASSSKQPFYNLKNLFNVLLLSLVSILSLYIYSQNIYFAATVTGACAVALVVFSSVIYVCRLAIVKLSERSLSFSLSYAMSMLTRKGSNTSVILSIGFTMLILFIISIQRSSLVAQFDQSTQTQRPNMVLFDVQPDQSEIVKRIVESKYGKIVSDSPIVTMRIEKINGKLNAEVRLDKDIPDWTLKREYRSTFRDHLIDGEKLVKGELIPEVNYTPDMIVPVTVDEGLANNLKVKIGDLVDFDVQGVQIKTKISGLRKVNWRRIQTNFFFVFPKGVLESAPYMSAFMVAMNSLENSSPLQNALLEQVPNVSAIDLKLVLDTTDELIDRVVMIIQFLGLFSLCSGVLILISSLYGTRLERVKESLVLRALGARQIDIRRSQSIEFLLLSLLALIPSFILSLVASYLVLSTYFDMEISLSYLSLSLQVSFLIVSILFIGLLFSNRIKHVELMHVLRD